MQTITTTNGHQTFKKTSAKVYIFAMEGNGTHDRRFLHERGEKVGGMLKTPASSHDTPDNGEWFTSKLQMEEDIVVSISSTISVQGVINAEGVVLLYLRDDAPLISVRVDVRSPKRGAKHQSVTAFIGRADILNVKEAGDFNIVYPRGIISRFFDEEELEEIYTIRELQKGKPRPTMVRVPTKDGRVKSVRLQKGPRRRVRIVKY